MRRQIRAVFRKELTDHLRDRRSLFSALLMPLLGPLVLAVMLTMLASWMRQDTPLEVPTVGRERAPNLVAFLERNGATVTEAPADYEAQVREGELELTLVIPEEYPQELLDGRSAALRLVVDNSRNETRTSVRRARLLLDAYRTQLGKLRLLARGVSPELAEPVEIDELDLATSAKVAGNLLNMVPYFLLLAAFMGGMHLAIDATAGERERGSLEPLLLNPVTRWALVLGKWSTTVVASWLSILVALLAFSLMLRRVPLEDLGIRASLGPNELVGLLAAILPLALFTGALQMLTATFARSFKEAQTYIQLLILLPTIPGMLVSFGNVKPAGWMMWVPTLGQQLLASESMRGEPLNGPWLLVAAVSSLGLAALCLAATTRLLANERIIFGRG